MATADSGHPRPLTVHEFTQRYRQAIGLQEIAVYKLMVRYHAQYGCAYPTQQTIADELGCSRETVNRAMRRLLAQALLHKQPVTVQGRSVVAYRPLIHLSDMLSQERDQASHSCDRLPHIGVSASPHNGVLHEKQPSQHGDQLSLSPCRIVFLDLQEVISMNQSNDFASDQLVAAFTQQLEALAQHHRQTCAVLGALRLMHDLDEGREPPQGQLSRLARATRRLLHGLGATTAGAPATATSHRTWTVMPDPFADREQAGDRDPAVEVVVIEAAYRVVRPDKEQ